MRYIALACDYDGTLASDGRVDELTLAALERVRASGRRLVLVTGRELDELMDVFPHLGLFSRVVAENGAVLYRPASREIRLLAEPPTEAFVRTLHERGVDPLAVGRVIVATWTPHETTVLDVIRDLGLEQQVIFNKGAVMVLPSGVNKATGLQAALDELALSPHNTVGVGDAENDHAFLSLCECAAAVANALQSVKDDADLVTSAPRGAGVAELIDKLVADDLAAVEPRLSRHDVLLGTCDDGGELRMHPYGQRLMLAGPSGSETSAWAIGVLEYLAERGYQCCVIDAKGAYEGFEDATALGDDQQVPSMDDVLDLLDRPDQQVVVNLLGAKPEDRPAYVERLLAQLVELRARTARPHWIVVNDADQLLPAAWDRTARVPPSAPAVTMLISAHPERIAQAALSSIDILLAVGEAADSTMRAICRVLGQPTPVMPPVRRESGQALAWLPKVRAPICRLRAAPRRSERASR